jgi:cell division protein FtsA
MILKDNINSEKSAGQQNVVVGLDIGTSKICALVAAPGEHAGQLNILGLGITESKGVARGFINNIEHTVKSIEEVIRQAEQQSGVKIEEVIVGIAGDHVESQEARGIIGNIGEIDDADVFRVIEETRKIAVPADRKILHVIPQEFIVDGQEKIYDPVGFSAVRMEALAHIITCKSSYIDTIYRCVERAGLKVKEVVLEPIASSVAVLEEDEKEIGVALIDIGGGTTDIAIFEKGILRFTSIFAIAGKKVTDDIQKGLGILARDAEKIKKEYGYTYLSSLNRDEIFMIPGIGGRSPKEISKNLLCQVIQPRMEEILEFALSEIERSGLRTSLGAGIVITGGSSLLRGTEELATDILGAQIKIGVPSNLIYGLAPEVENPMYSTAVGLALYGIENQKDNYNLSPNGNGNVSKNKSGKSISRFFKKVQEAINNL